MTMNDELKACPFCAIGKFEYNNDTGNNDEGFWEYWECNNCGARVNSEGLVNTRPIEDALRAEVERLKKVLDSKDRIICDLERKAYD